MRQGRDDSGGHVLVQLTSSAVEGIDAYSVHVEVDLALGLPCIHMVGLPESTVREGKERVAAAIVNSGYAIPPRRITINLAPADVRKEGSAFDLPIALGLLAGAGAFPVEALAGLCTVGELGLDGSLRPVRGTLSVALHCRARGVRQLIVPAANASEAAAVGGLDVRSAGTLREMVLHLAGEGLLERARVGRAADARCGYAVLPDMTDVRGHEHARRALEVAAAGAHNLLLVGPPGSGKSMLARRIPGILPPLEEEEAMEVTRIHSVAGRLRPGDSLVRSRPFRAPHHTISDVGMVGGGGRPRPGEVSLAHGGVLFLDELPEFRRSCLEALRQPLEDGEVHVVRARQAIRYPARLMLAAAMNPCPCGHEGDPGRACVCSPGQVERYRGRISGPLLDRIDLHVEVPALGPDKLVGRGEGEASIVIRERVEEARRRQLRRFGQRPGVFANAHLSAAETRQFCPVEAMGEALLREAIGRLGLSARGYHRVLKLARTLADLAGTDRIGVAEIAEAIQYRSLDRSAASSQLPMERTR